MRKKIVWILVSCLMILSLVIASCGPEEEAEEKEVGKATVVTAAEEEAEEEEEAVAPGPEVPEYGGMLSVIYPGDPMGFDEPTYADYFDTAGVYTHDELLEGDWAKGPAGTGEYTWVPNDNYRWDSKSGAIVERFELVEPGHFIFYIRQGVHFGLNPDSEASRLVNGREVTTDDVIWNIQRWTTMTGSNIVRSAPVLCAGIEVTKIDQWTIDVKVPVDQTVYVASYIVDWCSVYPKEVIERYGDMNDWHNSVGTGPFFLSDYVRSSVMIFKRNPNYWQKDPVGLGKGNQLPYVETVKGVIIPDASTQQSALRTGQIDAMVVGTLDTLNSLLGTAPDLVVAKWIPTNPMQIFMRLNKPELPFSNIKVRQALSMAIDYDTIIEDLFLGEALLPSYPIAPIPELKNAYVSLNEAPAAVKELFTYNPTRAKELLSEAGFPSGFKTSVICVAGSVDYLSVIKDMWEEINVELDIQSVEVGAMNSYWAARSFPEMLYYLQASSGTYVRMLNIYGTGVGWNLSCVDDPLVNETRDKTLAAFAAGNDAEVDRLHKALMPYVLEQAWAIQTPSAYAYTVWWPWLKGYHGEQSPGICNGGRWVKYVWIDQNLKRSMGY
ncbi:MAG: ABC transporter substrate-binding protein [Dehalococcoidia bacterium]|nr:ABC transporter substrate-binding protein [Dehalococcoidia bacterium]